MEKHCDVCNQSYPEFLESCPHCPVGAHSDTSEPLLVGEDLSDLETLGDGSLPLPPAQDQPIGLWPEDAEPALEGVLSSGAAQVEFSDESPFPPSSSALSNPAEAGVPTKLLSNPTPLSMLTQGEAPSAPGQGVPARPQAKTMLAGKEELAASLAGTSSADPKATLLAPQSGAKTSIAGQQELAASVKDLRTSADPKATLLSPQGGAKTSIAGQQEMAASVKDLRTSADPKATLLSPQGGAKTSIAGQQELAASVKDLRTSADPKATQLAPQSAPKTTLAGQQELAESVRNVKSSADPKATQLAPQSAPKTVLAGEQDMEKSLLDQETVTSPKATVLAPSGAPKTTLAGQQELAESLADTKSSSEPKATYLAPQAAQPTMLAGDKELDALLEGPKPVEDPKATQLAAQTRQPTMLAGEQELEALLNDMMLSVSPQTPIEEQPPYVEAEPELVDKTTKLAGQLARPTTLAGVDEMERLAREEGDESRKKTMLPSGAAKLTKLAGADEQLLLNLPAAPSDGEEPNVEISAVDLGSSPKLQGQPGSFDEPIVAAPADDMDALVAAAVTEEDAVATAAFDEPATTAKPEKKRKGGLLVGGVLGALLGSAACIGLLVFDVVPIDSIKSMVGMDTGSKSTNPTTPGGGAAAAPTGLAAAKQLLDQGEFSKAVDAIGQDNQTDPNALVLRGQARWLMHLQKTKGKPSESDKPVGDARKDLEAAKNGEGAYWLAHMEEVLKGPAAGRDAYKKGADTSNGMIKNLFQSALDRLDATADKPGAQSHAPVNDEPFPPPLLMLLLTAFQGDAAPATDSGEEAGIHFWKAAKLAKEGKFDDAVNSLKDAERIHDQRRYVRMRKAQNPNSDPTEEIFLRCSKELQDYWAIRNQLKGAPIESLIASNKAMDLIAKQLMIKDAKDFEEAVKKLLANNEQYGKIQQALTDAKYVNETQKDVSAGVKQLIDDKTAAADDISKAQDLLQKKNIQEKLVSQGVDSLLKTMSKLEEEAKVLRDSDGIFNEVIDRLAKAKYVDAANKRKKDREAIVKGVDLLLDEAYAPVVAALGRITNELGSAGGEAGNRLGKTLDLAGRLAASEAALKRYQGLQVDRLTPRQMLDVWVSLLQNERKNKELATLAARDAGRVARDDAEAGDLRAEAQCVEGLATRNLGQYEDARKSFEAARRSGSKGKPGDWREQCDKAMEELSDPMAYYIPEAKALLEARKLEEAVALLSQGIDAFSSREKQAAKLRAMRCRANLERARAQGRVDPNFEGMMKDAEAAIAAGGPDGHFAKGLVEEAMGRWKESADSFRQAIKMNPRNDSEGSSYRVALARVLLKQAQPAAVPANENRPPAGNGRADG